MSDARPQLQVVVLTIRRLYPTVTTCPECSHRGKHPQAGSRGVKRWRRCPGCRHAYPVFPYATEEDRGGLVSVIVPY